MFTPTSETAFGKGGILHLRFRKTGRHIAFLTLEQMCRLFYLKRATVTATFTVTATATATATVKVTVTATATATVTVTV